MRAAGLRDPTNRPSPSALTRRAPSPLLDVNVFDHNWRGAHTDAAFVCRYVILCDLAGSIQGSNHFVLLMKVNVSDYVVTLTCCASTPRGSSSNTACRNEIIDFRVRIDFR